MEQMKDRKEVKNQCVSYSLNNKVNKSNFTETSWKQGRNPFTFV